MANYFDVENEEVESFGYYIVHLYYAETGLQQKPRTRTMFHLLYTKTVLQQRPRTRTMYTNYIYHSKMSQSTLHKATAR